MAKLIIDIPQYVLDIAITEKTIADADIDMVANAIAKGKLVDKFCPNCGVKMDKE